MASSRSGGEGGRQSRADDSRPRRRAEDRIRRGGGGRAAERRGASCLPTGVHHAKHAPMPRAAEEEQEEEDGYVSQDRACTSVSTDHSVGRATSAERGGDSHTSAAGASAGMERVLSIRDECFADDVECREEMSTWSDDELRAYFERGGGSV